MKSHVLIAALGAVAVLGLAGAASAQSEYQAARSVFDRETVSVPVVYGDLDLATHDGAAAMLQRMHHAAMDACGASDFSVKDYRWSVARSACVHRSLDEAVASLNAPQVSELYSAGPNAWGA
jgi:UrcA family protein